MTGEMAEMCFELGLEQEYWERPNSLMQYECYHHPSDSYGAPIGDSTEVRLLQEYGAKPCEWSEIENLKNL